MMATNKWMLFLAMLVCSVLGWYYHSVNGNCIFGLPNHHRLDQPEKVKEILFFFRVPKTGSEMTVLLLQWLQGINGFRHVRLQNTVHRRLDTFEQRNLREEVLGVLSVSEGLPVAFDRHVYFTDLERLYSGIQRTSEAIKVNYFSSLRDPIDRIVSQFYYTRATPRPDIKLPPHISTPPPTSYRFQTMEECLEAAEPECSFVTGQHYDLQIPYFCGHDEHCTQLNNARALEQAKSNVELHFRVVGVLEQLNCTLRVAEKRIGTFFSGVQQLYFNELLEPKKNKNYGRPRQLREDLQMVLRNNLTMEYMFYTFVKQRLLEQCGESQNEN
ncbi:heparan sulfate 2-O-sulfotransferase pipe-like [Daphnia pulicaria]|uniref:heparan sulfate 2-O-sulfotransferase pipe-like n=1 Tax=Daphnia pulicaria TaxID=35523 RepID=UPI001EEBAB81|nr:heparan sulfate 2-O-sulfotransferase pipe-like [Daphnia pulicaria]